MTVKFKLWFKIVKWTWSSVIVQSMDPSTHQVDFDKILCHLPFHRFLCLTVPDKDFCVPLYLIQVSVSHYTWYRFLCPTVPVTEYCVPLYLIQISLSHCTWYRFLCPTVPDIDFCVALYLIQISVSHCTW